MRRRYYQTKVWDPPPNPIQVPDPSGSRADTDRRCRKKVKFVGVDENDSPTPLREVPAERSHDPKTSEYAFFKKFKSDASHRFNSKSLHKVEKNSKMFQSSYCKRGTNNPVKERPTNSSSSMPVVDEAFVNYDLYLSPVNVTPKDSEKDLKQQSSTPFGTMCSVENMKRQGNNLGLGDIFSTKRQKLHRWVRDTSFPDIDELTSKGYDFVSILLNRLLPRTEEKHDSKTPNKNQVDISDITTKSKLLDSPESDFLNRRLHGTFTGSLMQVETRAHLDNSTSIFWLDGPRERSISSLQFPASHVHDCFIRRDLRELNPEFGGNPAISCTRTDSVFSPPFRKYKPLPFSHLGEKEDFNSLAKSSYSFSSPAFEKYKPLRFSHTEEEEGGFYSLQTSSSKRHSSALLLGWDTVSGRNTDNLPHSYHDTKLIELPSAASSLSDNGNKWNVDDTSHNFCARELYSPSLPYSSDLLSFPGSHPTSYFKHESGRHILQNIDSVLDSNHLPLTLYDPHCSDNLTETCHYIAKHRDSSISPFAGDYYHSLTKIFNEEYSYPGSELHLSSGFTFDKGLWKGLSQSGSPREHYSSPYQTIAFPHEEIMSSPFLNTGKENIFGCSNNRRISHCADNMVNTYGRPSYYFHFPT